RIVPASGFSSPDNCAISVVLPAPLGPITACSSPTVTSSDSASFAVKPPNRLVRSAISSRASAMIGALPVQAGQQAAAGEQRDDDEDRPEHELPVLGPSRE